MNFRLLLIITLSNIPFWCTGQNLSPPIQNYTSYEYNAASKNWGLAIDNNGELYVANNIGLLHFNGETWTLNKLPNKTIIRSVAFANDKIFTGSYEEFGYWEMNNFGFLEYTSLTHLIKDHEFTNEEFWQLIQLEDSIIFRSFSISSKEDSTKSFFKKFNPKSSLQQSITLSGGRNETPV